MRSTIRLGNREVDTARYGGMGRVGFKTHRDELRIFLKAVPAGPSGPAQAAERLVIRGTENIDRAIAEITDALDPDEPDWMWQGTGYSGLLPRRGAM